MTKLSHNELKAFLDAKAEQYERPEFIASDPIQIPRQYTRLQDIEIAGFLTATIAWGNRKSILQSADRILQAMDGAPFEFVMHHQQADLEGLAKLGHRTFKGEDLVYFVRALRELYSNYHSLEEVFLAHLQDRDIQRAISGFKAEFFSWPHRQRTEKHLGDPYRNSAAKRMNMFLRWMVRPSDRGVDLGIWKRLSPADLSCPLDVHSGRVARRLGLLKRKQNDAKAVNELDTSLRLLDTADPVRYDYALFGLGVFEGF